MKLTYEVKDGGYIILNDGKPWIVQKDFLPYERETVAESAEAHIDAIIEDMNRPIPPTTEDQIEQLRDDLNRSVMELSLLMSMGGM